MAPLGLPVVPLVYCSAAVSPIFGRGWVWRSLRDPTNDDHSSAPFGRESTVRAFRATRALPMGSRRATLLPKGMASVRSTAITERSPMSAGKSLTILWTLSQTTATVAPWSSNWCRSSRSV